MSLGQNIREFRHQKGLTQKDLADQLYVTAQAVSRWENGEVEPSIEMLKTMATILEVKVEELINGRAEVVEEVEGKVAPAPVLINNNTQNDEDKDTRISIASCVKCGKKLYEGDQINYPTSRSGRSRHTHYNRPTCESCHRQNLSNQKKVAHEQARNESRKYRIHGFVWGGLAGAIVFGLMLSSAIKGTLPNVTLGEGIIYSIISTYAIFALIFTAILDNNFIGGMFGSIVSFSIRMPGLIFTLDLNGIFWLLTVKLALFILGIIGTILLFALAVVLCGFLAMFVFPFSLRKSYTRPEETGTAA